MRRPWEERLLEKVQVGPMDECWPWTAKARVKGYGVLHVDGKTKYAHRLMYGFREGRSWTTCAETLAASTRGSWSR